MKVGVFHPGTQHSRQTALALQDLGKLEFLATGLFDHPGSGVRKLAHFLPKPLRTNLQRELSRFAFPPLDPANVRTAARFELPERLARRAGFAGVAATLDTKLNHAFGRHVAKMAAHVGPIALWGYDGSADAVFSDPRMAEFPKILDRTTTDGRAWNAQRAALLESGSAWFGDASHGWSAERIAQDDREYAAADRIVCGSRHVIDSILEHSPVPGLRDKLHLLPYAFDAALFASGETPERASDNAPVRFLFVGQVAGRKGIRHLLEAIAVLPQTDASLTVVGPQAVPDRLLAPYRERVSFTGAIPRAEVPAVMRRHHALVFPSYNEGSATVLLEAMASGLAVIQTRASGLGASERSGIVLERPDTKAVLTAMLTLIRDRDALHEMRLAAKAESQQRDFATYRANIASLLEGLGV